MAVSAMCASVISTEKVCSHLKRDFCPVSVAWLMAGIRNCRVGHVVTKTMAIKIADVGSIGHSNKAATSDVAITNR